MFQQSLSFSFFCVFEIRNGFSFCGLSAKASAGSLASCFDNRFHFIFFVFSKFVMVLVSAGSLRRLLRVLFLRVWRIVWIMDVFEEFAPANFEYGKF